MKKREEDKAVATKTGYMMSKYKERRNRMVIAAIGGILAIAAGIAGIYYGGAAVVAGITALCTLISIKKRN